MSKSYQDKDDLELWLLSKVSDNSQAFSELHGRFAPKLYGLALRKTGSVEASEDLVQDLFVNLWIQRANISIEKALNLYLFSALKNLIISYHRKQMLRQTISLDQINTDTFVSQSANLVQEWLLVKEVQETYTREVVKLPEKSKNVFEMSRGGLPNKEIAVLLGLSEKTVEFHISKCLRILRVKFGYITHILLLMLFGGY